MSLDQIFDDVVTTTTVDARLAQLRDVVELDRAACDELTDSLVVDGLAMADDHAENLPRADEEFPPPIGSINRTMC